MATKLGFEVLKIVDIPVEHLRKNVLKKMDGRELYNDLSEGMDDPEKIYAGNVFENILTDYDESTCGVELYDEDLTQLDSLAQDLKDYEFVRVTIY